MHTSSIYENNLNIVSAQALYFLSFFLSWHKTTLKNICGQATATPNYHESDRTQGSAIRTHFHATNMFRFSVTKPKRGGDDAFGSLLMQRYHVMALSPSKKNNHVNSALSFIAFFFCLRHCHESHSPVPRSGTRTASIVRLWSRYRNGADLHIVALTHQWLKGARWRKFESHAVWSNHTH